MEVECLGACANAPMMQISHAGGDEYFVSMCCASGLVLVATFHLAPGSDCLSGRQEDLTPENVVPVLEAYKAGTVPPPGPQHGGQDAPPAGGVRAGPQPNGPSAVNEGDQRRGCEGPMGKTCLFDITGPLAPNLQ